MLVYESQKKKAVRNYVLLEPGTTTTYAKSSLLVVEEYLGGYKLLHKP